MKLCKFMSKANRLKCIKEFCYIYILFAKLYNFGQSAALCVIKQSLPRSLPLAQNQGVLCSPTQNVLVYDAFPTKRPKLLGNLPSCRLEEAKFDDGVPAKQDNMASYHVVATVGSGA